MGAGTWGRREGERGERSVIAYVAAGLLLVAAAAGLWIFWPQLTASTGEAQRDVPEDAAGEAPARVTAVVARRANFALRSEATGHLAPLRKVEITSEVQGRVVERPIREGDYVAEGDLLFRLDGREERIAVEEARGAVLKAQAQYASEIGLHDEGSVSRADTSRLSRLRGEYLEAQQEFREGTISRGDLQELRRRFEAAQMISGGQSSRVRAARTGLIAAEQQLARARMQLEQTHVRAPFAGRVADLEVDVGARVSPGQVQLTLLEDRRMTVSVDALESDLVHLEEGASATIRIPALEDTLLSGRIYTINPSVDPSTGTGRVTVSVPNPRGELVSGLFAFVELETRRLRDRLVVPEDALLVRQGRDLVFVIENGTAQWTYVDVGPRSSGYAVITGGISAGDTVAVDGHFALAHDAAVEANLRNRPYVELVEDPEALGGE